MIMATDFVHVSNFRPTKSRVSVTYAAISCYGAALFIAHGFPLSWNANPIFVPGRSENAESLLSAEAKEWVSGRDLL